MKKYFAFGLIFALLAVSAIGQDDQKDQAEKLDAIIVKSVRKLGGDKYLSSTRILSRGKFSLIQDRKITSFQSFVDYIEFPHRERTDFSEQGSRTVKVNTGDEGWIFEDHLDRFGPQTEDQIKGFKKSLKTHYDYLLRGAWKDEAKLTFAGRRQASLGKRNDVLKLTFADNFWVEYEISDEGLPMKVVYPSVNEEGGIISEENRFAQYLLTEGIYYPFVVDHFIENTRVYRVNYIEVTFGRKMRESIFTKPATPKKIKKLKF